MPSGISNTRTSQADSGERIAARARHQWRWVWVGVAAGLGVTAPRSAHAAETPDARDRTLPCRPTIACTADIVPPGTVELEVGVLHRSLGPSSQTHDGGSSAPRIPPTRPARATRQWTFPFLAKLTLAPWVQVQVGSNGLTEATGLTPQDYFDDLVVGAKFHLLDQSEWAPAVSVSAEASVPTFPGEGYLRTYDAFFTTYVTKDFGPVHADCNLAWNLWRFEVGPPSQGLVALALTANTPPPFGVMGEAYYFTDDAPVAPRDGGLLFAFTHSPRSWLVFDLGADVGWFPSTRAYSVFVGMAIIPVVLWRPSPDGVTGVPVPPSPR